jgi:hypothetical protein
MRRLYLALVLSVFSLAALGAPGAEAARVESLKPWKPANHYLVTADLDGRTGPKSDPRAQVNYLRKGQWVQIACQAAGENAYGSNLWDKVGAYYVPDTYIKTYTSGRIPGAPRCKSSSPAPAPPPPPQPPQFPNSDLPSPQGGYGSYSQTYELGTRFKSWEVGEMTRELTGHFSRYFPFKGCGRKLTVGKTCRLQAPGPDGPVKITAIAANGFALLSQPGHPEGAGRTITFRWARWCNAMSDYLYCEHTYLQVNAWGPVSNASLAGPLNALTIAKHYWTQFSKTVRARYPRCPPGKAWVKSQKACSVII